MPNDKWMTGLNDGDKHWVLIPGLARGINAGSADRAVIIAHSVNIAPELIAALHDIVEWTTDPHARQTAQTAIEAADKSLRAMFSTPRSRSPLPP
jgi:hypothetical protein